MFILVDDMEVLLVVQVVQVFSNTEECRAQNPHTMVLLVVQGDAGVRSFVRVDHRKVLLVVQGDAGVRSFVLTTGRCYLSCKVMQVFVRSC